MSEATTTTASRRIRSTSDRDLAARHDSEPYENVCTGERHSVAEHQLLLRTEKPSSMHAYEFAPRVECIPSRDPKPYGRMVPHASRLTQRYTEAGPGLVYDPRPEYARVEQNPILAYLREAMGRYPGLVLAAVAEEQLYSIREARMFGAQATYGFDATPDDIEGAHAVLKRIMGVFG